MKAIKQILYDFRHQSVISWVTLLGTMLAVFLIMIVVMMQQIQIAPFAPESNRDRTLYGRWLAVEFEEGTSSSRLNYDIAKQLYDSLPNVEATSYAYQGLGKLVVSVKGKLPKVADIKKIDDQYWKIFNHSFIKGNPFNKAQYEGNMKVAVITESLARDMFETADVVNHEIMINHLPYKIIGVIKDVSSLATEAYGQVFIPLPDNEKGNYDNYFGSIMVYLLAKSPEDIPAIRSEVERRYTVLNTQDRGDNSKFVYNQQPFTQEMLNNEHGSNNPPSHETARKTRYFIFALLLVVPAINLSSMTQSRLRRRIGELGVRRAFGCTRSKIISDLLVENFILTIAGGIIGLILSIVFTYMFSDIIFVSSFDDRSAASMYVTPEMVFNLPMFLWTLFFCLILNILSAGIPAWRASRINPVEAINMGNK
ncbi:MAG: ABC transporter permease [Muribaculaceae bacterium]|nr:ABC transporter permease [Muribaculaceae bacterium]MDE5856830.1 ABC transporter permease [Muribaculaceae bacterium]